MTGRVVTKDELDAIEAEVDARFGELRWLADRGARFCLPRGRTKGKDDKTGKPTLETNWQNSPHTYEEAERHARAGGNVGMLTGSHSGGVVAVDIDKGFPEASALLGEMAHTVKVVRDNAPDRGKLLFRCTGELPPSKAWKPAGAKHPEAEFLADGRQAIIPPSEYKGGSYRLIDTHLDIREATPEELNGLWFLITGEFLTPVPSHKEERRKEASGYVAQVKAAWTPLEVFNHFGRAVAGELDERGEVRLLGNGGLLCKAGEPVWYCFSDSIGGDALDAWHYCEHGSRLPRDDKDAFWRTLNAMGEAAGIPKPSTNGASYNGFHAETPDGSMFEAPPAGGELETDMGNALRMARLHGDKLRYVDAWGWLFWDGARWQRDATGQVMRYAKDTARSLYDAGLDAIREAEEEAQAMRDAVGENPSQEVLKQLQDQVKELLSEAKGRLSWAIKSQARNRLDAMIHLSRSDAPIPASATDFDADPWLLNVRNGVLNLRTGELLPHEPSRLCSKLAPVDFDTGAECPTWLAFLDRIFAGDAALIAYLQRWLGYCLTGKVTEQTLHVLWGGGSNGKSVLWQTVLTMLGDYADAAPPDLLLAKDRDGHPTAVADLQGKRFVVSVETEENRRLAEGLVKQLTGGDKVKARFLFKDFFSFSPSHKLALITNHKPRVKGTDHAIWRRLRLIPFEVTIPDSEQDKDLPAKLERELAGILAWTVRGCLEWQRDGLNAPSKVNAATEEYRAENDHLGSFIAECIEEVDPSERVQLQAKELYRAYCGWCDDHGERPLNGTAFGLRLTDKGLDKYVHPSNRRTYYLNVRLVAPVGEGSASAEDAAALGFGRE